MKNELLQTFRWVVIIALLIVAISAIMLVRPQASSQQSATSLSSKLEQAGVPVKSVQIIQQSPLQVEITLQSSSNDNNATQDDLWNKFLASRDAELAYLNGNRIDSYRLILINSKGEIISSEWVYLDTTLPSQNIAIPKPAALDETETKELLIEKLNTPGMKIVSLDVTTDKVVLENTRLVELHFTFASGEDASNSINTFILSLRPLLKDLNENYGAQIAVFRLIVYQDERLLIEYLLDLDRSTQMWSLAKGIEANWFPCPVTTRNADQSSNATATPGAEFEAYPQPTAYP
jgi:hypothetical protein